MRVESGSRISSANRDTSQGAYSYTGGSLDAMINGEGYFAVQNYDGSVSYTRSGSFALSDEGGAKYLVASSGGYVLGADNNKIQITGDLTEDSLSGVALYKFDNSDALIAQGDNKFSAGAGTAVPDTESKLTANAVELSNVNLITEMTKMMTAQRGFQYNSKMVQTADEIEQTVNNLRN
jgi:flagellar basal-body rod protein FlgG